MDENIKGYTEYSIWKELNIDNDITKRFNNEKDILRMFLEPAGNAGEARLLLSIITIRTLDYFNMLVADKVIASDYYPVRDSSLENFIYNIINNSIMKQEKLPTLKTITASLEIPYSKEFFDEYIYDDTTLDLIITARYKALREVYCKQLAEYLQDNDCPNDELMKKINKVDYMSSPPTDDMVYEKLESAIESRTKDTNILTGIEEIDIRNAYLQKGQITTIFAYTGSFKTMCCSNITYNVASAGNNVVYFALEISKELMYINLLSRHSNEMDKQISHTDVKHNNLTEEDRDYLYRNVYPDFSNDIKKHIIVYDETDINANSYEMYSKLLFQADSIFKRKTGHGVDVVVIDHLNLLKFDSLEKAYNDYSAINHWMSFFRKNAINFLNQNRKISILCACQSSREGYKNACKNGRYDLTGIAEGNEIERSSQVVLSIFYVAEKMEYPCMQILKSRDDERCNNLLRVGVKPEYYMFGFKVKQSLADEIPEYDDYSECNKEGMMSCN